MTANSNPEQTGLRQSVILGTIWSGSGIVFRTFTQIVVTTILARLLLPEEFGLVALVSVFVSFGQLFADGGFGAALIQKKELDENDKATVFYFNLAVASACYGLLVLFIPYFASLVSQPELIDLMPILGLAIPIRALGLVQDRLFHRNIRLKIPAILMNVSTLVGGIVGIVYAFNGAGVWSLVYMTLTIEIIRLVGLWALGKWFPTGRFQVSSFKQMAGFGINIFGSRFLTATFNNIYSIVIGVLYSPAQLGFYSRALRYQQLPSNTVAEAAKKAVFPALSRLQEDRPKFINALRKAQSMVGFLVLCLMAILFALCEHLVLLVLTEKWLPLVPYFRILCIAGALYPITLLDLSALNAMGRSDKSLKLQTIKTILLAVAVASTWHLGVLFLVWGQVASTIVWTVITVQTTQRQIGYSVLSQFRDLFFYAVSAVATAAVIMLLLNSVETSYWLEILLGSVVGFTTYLMICLIFKTSAISELGQMFMRLKNKRTLAA